MREKEAHQLRSQLQELNVRREAEVKEAQCVALKFKELVHEHKNQTERVNLLQSENDKLAKVLPCLILNR